MPVPYRKAPLAAAVGAALVSSPAGAYTVSPFTGEFELAADGSNTNQVTPDVAMADDGSFVAVWEDGGEIFAQRFAADGSTVGGEISVPRFSPSNPDPRTNPTVGMDDDGDFAVGWQGYYGYGYGYYGDEIVFHRFDATGATVGSAVRATQDPNLSQFNQIAPDIALDADGDIAITWQGNQANNDEQTISYRLFGATSGKQTGILTAPDDPGPTQTTPSIGRAGPGEFVIGWQYGTSDILARRFGAGGSALAAPIQVNASAPGPQENPSVAVDDDGDFVVAWENYAGGNDAIDVRAFDATGSELIAQTSVAQDGETPAVALFGTNEASVAWRALPGAALSDGDLGTILLSTLDAGGAVDTGPVQVNETTTGEQDKPAIAIDADGDAVVGFESYASSVEDDVLGRLFGRPPVADAGADRTVVTGGSVTLDGSGSTDPVGNSIGAFNWTQTGGTSVTLADSTSATPSFTAPSTTGTLTFQVEVTDDQGLSATDTVAIEVAPSQEPVEGTAGGALGWLGGLVLGALGVGRAAWRRRRRRRRGSLGGLLAGALAIGLAGGTPPAQAQRPGPGATEREAGRVEEVSGTVTAERGQTTRSLEEAAVIYVGDLVRTGADAAAVLRLADGSRIALRAESTFRVSRLERTTDDDGDSSLTGMLLDLVRGGLRAVTGGVAERNPGDYRLRTPVATIGVRGTEFDARLCPRRQCPGQDGGAADDAGAEPAARVVQLSGVVEARAGDGGTRVLDEGARVFQGDSVRTADDAWAVLRFADGSKVALEPGTAFAVRAWEYDDGEPEDGNALLRLVRGGMRVLSGLIGSEQPGHYRVSTPVATIGVRGTGFDLLCQGDCVDPDATNVTSTQGDGMFVRAWEGEVYAELEGRTAEFAVGETGFLANDTASVRRPASLPGPLQGLVAPRPDTVTGSIPQSSDRLYTYTREGAITVRGRTGPATVFEAGQAGVTATGQTPRGLPEAPGDFVGPGDVGVAVPTIMGALGSLALGQFELGTAYAGGTAGAGIAGSESEFEDRLQRSNPGASVDDLSGGAGLRGFVGYRLLGVVAVEVGGFDMGDTDSEIDPGTDDPAAVARNALDKHPITPRGVDISALARTPIDATGTGWAFARAGIARWEGEVTTRTPSGETFSKEFSGTDAIVGGGVEYRLSPNLHARTEWIHYRLEPDPVNYVGAGLVWTFP